MDHDVVVVGASIAGTAAATLLARQGARVALVEKRPDPAAYKVVCSHYVQPSAVPVLDRLGVLDALHAAGAVRGPLRIWTRYGWVREGGPEPRSLNVTRQTLDPLLRDLAARTPGVDLLLGRTVTGLLGDGGGTGRPAGVRLRDGAELRARVVVAADGRGSGVARLAGVPARVRPHRRFGYMAYYEGLGLDDPDASRLWLRDPDVSYVFPNEHDRTVLACFVHRDRLAAFKRDPEAAFLAQFAGLPDAPDLRGACRTSKLIGKLDLPNAYRPAGAPGLAFAGDAALAADPLWGVGCGFALQSAEWLADLVGPVLAEGAEDRAVDHALRRYRRHHAARLLAQHWSLSDYASGRPLNPMERLLFRGATRDVALARTVHAIGSRARSPLAVAAPATVARTVRANLLPAA